MTKDNILYFLAQRELYREGKIDLLSAQSSNLKSREIIKNLIQLKTAESTYRTKIIKGIAKVRAEMKKFEKVLPKTRGKMPITLKDSKTIASPEIRKARRAIYKDPIQQEINDIQEKLKALGA
jgi:hypothetical protein